MKQLYPAIEPKQTFFLETTSQHQVYVEESGNPQGIPVIFLHGGPCSGTKPEHRSFFNPQLYRIILIDQRGSGLSLPFGELENNTTQDLIADLERLRQQLAIPQWLLFGGSWGATLALLYAQQYPEKVLGMILRGVFLARQKDADWYLHGGAGRIYPEQWQYLRKSVTAPAHTPILQSLCDGFWSADELAQRRIAKAWLAWGAQVALGNEYQPSALEEPVTEKMLKQVAMELHYAKNHYFIENYAILDHCQGLQNIPTTIIHGRYDMVCPIEAAFALHKNLPNADRRFLPTAGHIARGEAMIDALVSATDDFAQLIL